MEIDKAYCVELNQIVTPYGAKDAFFDDNNNAEKFHFTCYVCKSEIYGANIYTEALKKQRPNFRTMPLQKHAVDCPYKARERNSPGNGEDHGDSPKRIKGSPFPTELILYTKPGEYGVGRRKDVEGGEPEGNKKKSPTNTDSKGLTKTSVFEFVVDCFERAGDADKNNYSLTIGNKTKSYAAYFKEIRDFKDEEGLVYFGRINKRRFKELPDGYRIVFEDKVVHDEKRLAISVYISKTSIELYRRKRYFELNVNRILSAPNENAVCYFVGAYPKLKTVPLKTGPTEHFLVYDVEMKNPNHLVIKFSDMGSR